MNLSEATAQVMGALQQRFGGKRPGDTALQAKAVGGDFFPRGSWFSLALGNTDRDYEGSVGTGLSNSIIMAVVKFYLRVFPEAPVMLSEMTIAGGKRVSEDRVWEHPFLDILDAPNPYYSGVTLWAGMIISYVLDGNAYWLKVRSAAKRTVQLYYIPQWLIEPKWEGNDFISYYEYRPMGTRIELPPSDVIHFRDGIDPTNIRKGLSPLKSLFREVFTDDEAANYTATLLQNFGIPGLIVAPKEGTVTRDNAALMKAELKEAFTRDRRGEPFVGLGPTDVHQFGFNPSEMVLKELRRIPEERVTAVLGIPAVVAGLGAGLDRSTFTNMGEARELAYESGIIPIQRHAGADVKRQLLGDYEPESRLKRLKVGFDLNQVRVLQEDESKKAERKRLAWLAGAVERAEYRAAVGEPIDEARDHVFFMPVNGRIVPSADAGTATPLPAPKGAGVPAG